MPDVSSYIADYRRLEDNATADENAAERYRRRADENRWEQCRIAYEATTEGGYSQRKFAEAVGRSQSLIGTQARMWQRWGDQGPDHRPSYADGHEQAFSDRTWEDRKAENTRSRARNLPPEEKLDLVREFVDDPHIGDQVVEIVEDEGIQRRASRAAARPPMPEPRAAGRQAGDSMARKLDTDLATAALRAAAGSVAEAILCREEFGVRNHTEFAEALTRLRHLVAAVEAKSAVSDDDRSWLESIGVEL